MLLNQTYVHLAQKCFPAGQAFESFILRTWYVTGLHMAVFSTHVLELFPVAGLIVLFFLAWQEVVEDRLTQRPEEAKRPVRYQEETKSPHVDSKSFLLFRPILSCFLKDTFVKAFVFSSN